jgi:hypothetical protein
VESDVRGGASTSVSRVVSDSIIPIGGGADALHSFAIWDVTASIGLASDPGQPIPHGLFALLINTYI